MRNPYAQVALTYVRRPFSSWRAALVVFPGLFLLVLLSRGSKVHNSPMFFLAFAYPFGALAVHAKEQFADSRAHLMPRFRRIHAAAAVVGAVLITLSPILLAWLAGTVSFGFVAALIFVAAFVLWYVLLPSAWFGWVFLALFFIYTFGLSGQGHRLASGQLEEWAAAISLIGMAGLIYGGIRLFCLNEEMAEYRCRWFSKDRTTGQGSTDSEAVPPVVKNWFVDRQAASMIYHAQRAVWSWWSRIRRWQVGMVSGWSAIMWSFVVLLMVPISAWHSTTHSWQPVGLKEFCFTYLSVIISLVYVSRRERTLQFEMLLPVSGNAYFRQVGAAFALSHLRLWIAVSLVLLGWWSITAWDVAKLGLIVVALLFSACCQIWTLGVIAWLARFPLFAVLIPVVLGLALPWPFLLTWEGELSLGFVLAFGLMAVFGVALVWDVYRRWLPVEFD